MLKISAEQVYKYVVDNPGLKASKIALSLGSTRKEVNSIIYRHLSDRLVKDENHCWYLIGSPAVILKSVSEKSYQEPVTKNDKDIVNGTAYIRGNSIFRIKHHHNKILIETNSNHPFVSKLLVDLGEDANAAFINLLEAFSVAVEKHYDDADLIEELIDDWGTILASKLNKVNL